jgi:hypothetical protein
VGGAEVAFAAGAPDGIGEPMAEGTITKLRIKSGSLELRFEGSETFLRSDVPKLVKVVNDLHRSEASISAGLLRRELDQSISIQTELDEQVAQIKKDLDSLTELGEMESLRLQMAMDRISKMTSTLSNLLKKASDTASGIVQNLK